MAIFIHEIIENAGTDLERKQIRLREPLSYYPASLDSLKDLQQLACCPEQDINVLFSFNSSLPKRVGQIVSQMDSFIALVTTPGELPGLRLILSYVPGRDLLYSTAQWGHLCSRLSPEQIRLIVDGFQLQLADCNFKQAMESMSQEEQRDAFVLALREHADTLINTPAELRKVLDCLPAEQKTAFLDAKIDSLILPLIKSSQDFKVIVQMLVTREQCEWLCERVNEDYLAEFNRSDSYNPVMQKIWFKRLIDKIEVETLPLEQRDVLNRVKSALLEHSNQHFKEHYNQYEYEKFQEDCFQSIHEARQQLRGWSDCLKRLVLAVLTVTLAPLALMAYYSAKYKTSDYLFFPCKAEKSVVEEAIPAVLGMNRYLN